MRKIILLVIVLIGCQSIGQITGRILDDTTKDPIPYANIQYNGTESLISNVEGFFTISDGNESATLVITYLGYSPVQLTVAALASKNFIVGLQPIIFELDEVKLAKRLSAKQIMAEVKKNLKQNYTGNGALTKDNIFIRESNSFFPKQLKVEVSQSTGFTKKGLKDFNRDVDAYTSRLVSHPPKEFTDMLCNFYTAPKKTETPHKLEVLKATKLKDEKRSASLDGLQDNASNLLLKHLDTTKYYRIKSGWFGSKDTVSLRKDFNKKKNKKQLGSEVESAKTKLTNFKTQNSIFGTGFEFVNNPDLYEYHYEGAVFLKDGSFAYVLTFKPDKRKAKYVGKLYVSDGDFAVLRAEYTLDEGEKVSGVNMKLLLGVKSIENLRSGTAIYKQNPEGDGYYLQYASVDKGQYFYLNRPLKFIELAESEKDVVEFDLKIEGNSRQKVEYLTLSRSTINDSQFDAEKEANFKYVSIKQYDPKIWKDLGAIEPLEEMKQFKIEETP